MAGHMKMHSLDKTRNRIDYTVVCVSEFANKFNMTKKDAFAYLEKNKALEFLKNNYEAEHLLSIEDAVEDMEFVCKKNEVMR